MEWQAHWIGDGSEEPNRYFYVRKSFSLPECVQGEVYQAVVQVCAHTGYKLYVNGAFVQHGPARSDLLHPTYDTGDICARLRVGENVIAALVHYEGIGTCASFSGRSGFLLQGEIRASLESRVESLESSADGRELVSLQTDDTWKICPAPYRWGYERISIQLAYPEDFDARDEPLGWNAPGFDDSGWSSAVVLTALNVPFTVALTPRDIPHQMYRTIAPASLIQVNVVEKSPAADFQHSTPAEEMQRATRLLPAAEGGVTWKHPALFTVKPVEGEIGTSVVLDFGREVSGWPWFQIRQGGGGQVDVGYSERIEADGCINPNHWGGCDVHYADRFTMRPGPMKWIPFHPRAFRYIRLDFYDCPEPVEVLCEMDTFGYPVEYRGDFQCSDPLLNRIWEVGRYTAELCMDDAFMDCPWRERGQWLADTRVEALVAFYAFGDTKLARRAWLQYAQSQEREKGTARDEGKGMRDEEHLNAQRPTPNVPASAWLKCIYPGEPPFDARLPTFNCLWFNGLWEYFLHTGDRSLLQAAWPYAERLLQTLQAHESENGLLHNLPGWVFVDWAAVDVRGEASHVNAFYYGALLAAAKIARTVGRPERGSELEMRAADVKDALNDLLWDNVRGLYVDCRIDGQFSEVASEQANVLCLLYGIAERSQEERVLEILFGRGKEAQKGTTVSPSSSPSTTTSLVPIATPYFAFYLLRMLYVRGRHAQALAYTRAHWGDMLARGATTFWEQYEPQWSLCHAWSAAPTYDFPAELAGIRPTQPGFEEFVIDIQPIDLSWFRARVPSVRGEIAVDYHYRTDKPFVDQMGGVTPPALLTPAITVNLRIPRGTRADVRVPLEGISVPSVEINGDLLLKSGVAVPGSGGEKLILADSRLCFNAPPGRYHIAVYREEGVDNR